MNDRELCYCKLSEIACLLFQREISPVDLLDIVLARIERMNPLLNAFISITPESAYAAARQAESELMKGNYRGPLHGVPVSVKDLYATQGVRTTGGSKVLATWVPDYDATVVARLRDAGALLVGKTNLPEFAWGPTANNSYYGTTRNPWDRDRIAGGSSAGAAAAVASGLGYLSMGTETGESIRRPAALCGIVGLKPTYGLVSRFGILPGAWSLDHAGPLVRSVRDAALVLEVLAGHDPKDVSSQRVPKSDYTSELDKELAGLRIGIPDEYLEMEVDDEILVSFEKAVVLLEHLGARRVNISLPSAQYAALVSTTIAYCENAAYYAPLFLAHLEDLEEDTRRRFVVASSLTATDYLNAQRARRAIGNEVDRIFREIDLIVSPTTATPATLVAEGAEPLHDHPVEIGYHLQAIRRLFSLLGLPVVSIPCGYTGNGLPMGLQIGGRHLEEATVLRGAFAYERETDWLSHGLAQDGSL